MGLFGHGQSDGWRKKTQDAVAFQRPVIAGVPNPIFPWSQLRLFTDNYLKKKSDPTPEARDARLRALVQKHGAKDIALAAIAHAMSPDAVRDLLVEEHANYLQQESDTGLSIFLQILITAHHVNPEAVGEHDAQIARSLIISLVPSSATFGENLKMMIEQLIGGIPPNSLLHQHLRDVTRKHCSDFANQLLAWKADCQWLKAQAEVGWLSKLKENSEEMHLGKFEAIQLLEEGFPEWRRWAEWKPNFERLCLLERIKAEQRRVMNDILALEGPDFDRTKEPTMRKGLVARYIHSPCPILQHGTLQVSVPNGTAEFAEATLERLSNALEAACKAGSDDIDLFIHLCVDKIVCDDVLKILEAVNSVGSPLLTADVLQVYGAIEARRASQMVAVMRLCQVLDEAHGQNLREDLAPHLVDCISRTVHEMQRQLCLHLENKQLLDDMNNMDIKLHQFGEGLQRFTWIEPMFDDSLRNLLRFWPISEKMRNLRTLWNAVCSSPPEIATSLSERLIEYYWECLIEPGTSDLPTRNIIDALITLWNAALDGDRRALALRIAQGRGKSKNARLRCDCLAQLPTLPDEFVRRVLKVLQDFATDADKACVNFVSIFASVPSLTPEVIRCWRPALLHMMKQREATLIDFALNNFTALGWFKWLEDIHMIFVDLETHDPLDFPTILQPVVHEWCQRISRHLGAITYLESVIGSGATTHCLLTGFQGPWSENIVQILEISTSAYQELCNGGEFPATILAIMEKLERDGSNARVIRKALSFSNSTTMDCDNAYLRTLEIYHQSSPEVAMVFLKIWQKHPNMTTVDKMALETLGQILGIDLDGDGYSHAVALDAAAEYANRQVVALVNQAQRLSDLRRSLKALDPEGTSEFLAEHGIKDVSPLDDELASLPTELVHVVEKLGDDEVELHFPLTHLNIFQRVAIGAGDSQSLLVRLVLGNYGDSSGFCIHLDSELKLNGHTQSNYPESHIKDCYDNSSGYNGDTAIATEIREILRTSDLVNITLKSIKLDLEKRLGIGLDAKRDYVNSVIEEILSGHVPIDNHSHVTDSYDQGNSYHRPLENNSYQSTRFKVHDENVKSSSDHNLPTCQKQTTRITYHLERVLSKHLLQDSRPIAETYKLLKNAIDNLRHNCLVCGLAIGVRLQRPTVCPKPICRATWLKASLDLQLADFHCDSKVADLLLSAVQAAANSGNMALLPGCTESSAAMVTQLLGTIPSVATLRAVTDLDSVFTSVGKRTGALASWALGNYGGYLVSATGTLRIPNMSGVHQFVLANAAPDLEKFFAAQMGGLPTHVMFHGTSLDRLYAILCQGLRVCSGTNLMRHGAVSGNGIYVTDNPATAMTYAQPCGTFTRGWRSTDFSNARVLLGCEASGSVPAGGIRVVANPSQLILRYVFIMTAGAVVPQPQHVVPAMTSVFASLRSGGM